MNYQWYPGHMTKARRMMQENIKLIDLIIEVVDALEPLSQPNLTEQNQQGISLAVTKDGESQLNNAIIAPIATLR